jgi:hypothetical protein
VTPDEIARSLVGAVAKEDPADLKVLREYAETVARGRSGPWGDFYRATKAWTAD